VFNHFLVEAIRSILNQSYENIELIIIANGKCSKQIFNSLKSLNFESINGSVIIKELSIGQLSFALNYGISVSNGELIARMDADDISHPSRIAKQVDYLMQENVDFVGTQLNLINEKGIALGQQNYPLTKFKIDYLLPFKNCFAHNSILVKKKVFLDNGGYLGGFSTEDYDFWIRLRSKNINWCNMPDALVDYRVLSSSNSRHYKTYAEATAIIFREFLQTFKLIYFFGFVAHLLRLPFKYKNE
jgi:O86/O127-antigen biosynthesis beta-1,3-galactosyltransferase